VDPIGDLPSLPESRSNTPTDDNAPRTTLKTTPINGQDTPTKLPSQSAVPLKFIVGNRSRPSPPDFAQPPLHSPPTPREDSLVYPRPYRPNPTSWASEQEYRPLYLVENNRRRSSIQSWDQLPQEPSTNDTYRPPPDYSGTAHSVVVSSEFLATELFPIQERPSSPACGLICLFVSSPETEEERQARLDRENWGKAMKAMYID